MSPLKKLNRVAPSPGTIGPLKFTPEEGTSLQSSSASLLDQKTKDPVSSLKRERPDSAPQADRHQVPIDVKVIVKPGGEGARVEQVASKFQLS